MSVNNNGIKLIDSQGNCGLIMSADLSFPLFIVVGKEIHTRHLNPILPNIFSYILFYALLMFISCCLYTVELFQATFSPKGLKRICF